MTLAAREHGTRNDRSVLLVHGGGGAGWMWSAQLEALSAFHVIVIDLPEHGESRDEGPFSIARSSQMLAELLRARAHDSRAAVVGLSLGAQIALQLASDAPAQVDRLLATGALVRPIFGASAASWMARAYWPIKDAPWLVRMNMRALGVPEKHFEQFAAETRATSIEAFVRISEENMAFRVPSGLASAQVPATIVVGSKEPSVMRASARDLRAAMPSARAFCARGQVHNWPMANPALFNAAMLAWLGDQPLPAELEPIEP